jgi:Skp family chaperone for outer membrane proteins
MTSRILPLAAAAALVVVSAAAAQQPATQPKAPAPGQPNPALEAFKAVQARPPGPVVPGLCVLSREGIIATSTVGQYAARELERIEQAANAELNTARTTAETNVRALQTQMTAGTLNQQAYATQANQIGSQLQNLLDVRIAEVRETDARVQRRIMEEATPLILEAFRAKNCSALFDQAALIIRGDSYDVTQDVVTRLNAKLTSFPIERVQAQAPAPAGAPGAPPPVATTPAAPGRGAQGPTR